MSLKNTVVLITLSIDVPASLSIAPRLSIDCFAAFLISSDIRTPVSGLIGSCPDTKSKFPAFIACEYGPMAAGAFDVLITVFSIIHFSFYLLNMILQANHNISI